MNVFPTYQSVRVRAQKLIAYGCLFSLPQSKKQTNKNTLKLLHLAFFMLFFLLSWVCSNTSVIGHRPHNNIRSRLFIFATDKFKFVVALF